MSTVKFEKKKRAKKNIHKNALCSYLLNITSSWVKQPYLFVLTGGNQFAAVPIPRCTQRNVRQANFCDCLCGTNVPDEYLVIRTWHTSSTTFQMSRMFLDFKSLVAILQTETTLHPHYMLYTTLSSHQQSAKSCEIKCGILSSSLDLYPSYSSVFQSSQLNETLCIVKIVHITSSSEISICSIPKEQKRHFP